MAQDPEDIAESAWREGFRIRLIEAQGKRTNEVMGELLQINPNTYSKYRGRGSMMPTRLLPKFCKICDVDLEWLIVGDKAAIAVKEKPLRRKTS